MPAIARAHLLLPSPKGLVHYDLLEGTAFLGAGPKGGLTATAGPFRGAVLALTDDGAGYVARALPGEPPVEVNGAPADGARLADGDRVRVAGQVVLFRCAPTPAAVAAALALASGAPPPPPSFATPAAPRAAARSGGRDAAGRAARAGAEEAVRAARKGTSQAATGLALAGALVLLFSAYQAVRLLSTPRAPAVPPPTFSSTEDPEPVLPRAEEAAEKDLAAADAFAAEKAMTGQAAELEEVVARYSTLARKAPGTSAAHRAGAMVTELWPRLAALVWKGTSDAVDAATRNGKYRTAMQALESFEARFAGTPTAAELPARIEAVRTQATAALDALRVRAAPLVQSDPTRAYRVLTSSGLELPPDLEAELGALMAQVRELWAKPEPGREGGREPPPGPTPGSPPRRPGSGVAPPPAAPPGEGPTPGAGSEADAAARSLWLEAHDALLARKWAEAKKGYARLLKEYPNASCVRAHPERVRAGRQAADFGIRGPAALLREEATWKDGRLECEWSFDDDKAFLADFVVEQPMAGDDAAEAEVRSGMAILSGNASMMLKVVFDPTDVTWEADCVADDHRDYGLLGVQEGTQYRAIAMEVWNTQFRLKKGAAAKVLAAHVLWMFGDGVWRDADPGTRGFIRIDLAEKGSSGLKSGERVRVRCELHGGQIGGEIHGKTEGIDLKGALKGDDGKGVGPLRIGAFAYKSRVGIDRLWVSGKVDEAWAAKAFQALLALETGPE